MAPDWIIIIRGAYLFRAARRKDAVSERELENAPESKKPNYERGCGVHFNDQERDGK